MLDLQASIDAGDWDTEDDESSSSPSEPLRKQESKKSSRDIRNSPMPASPRRRGGTRAQHHREKSYSDKSTPNHNSNDSTKTKRKGKRDKRGSSISSPYSPHSNSSPYSPIRPKLSTRTKSSSIARKSPAPTSSPLPRRKSLTPARKTPEATPRSEKRQSQPLIGGIPPLTDEEAWEEPCPKWTQLQERFLEYADHRLLPDDSVHKDDLVRSFCEFQSLYYKKKRHLCRTVIEVLLEDWYEKKVQRLVLNNIYWGIHLNPNFWKDDEPSAADGTTATPIEPRPRRYSHIETIQSPVSLSSTNSNVSGLTNSDSVTEKEKRKVRAKKKKVQSQKKKKTKKKKNDDNKTDATEKITIGSDGSTADRKISKRKKKEKQKKPERKRKVKTKSWDDPYE